MGVLNVTPDSFSDGGAYSNPDVAVAHGLALLDQGADILDIGGESTRPGVATASVQAPALAGAVSAEEEIDRVLPVIEAIKRRRPESVLSIDTYKSKVAAAALEGGVEIVNDVSGFTWDSRHEFDGRRAPLRSRAHARPRHASPMARASFRAGHRLART